jgi:hypothetical protein
MRRHNQTELAVEVTGTEYIRDHLQKEVPDVVRRAVAAGAVPPLDYKGAGVSAIVLCDARGIAYKTARPPVHEARRHMLREEAAWLHTANQIPWVKDHVARFYKYHPREAVIERECVQGKIGGWGSKGTWEVHRDISRAMLQYGWTVPEYKEDSFVLAPGRGWVLVDAGFAYRVGRKLVEDVLNVLNGRRPIYDEFDLNGLAFDLRQERGKTVPVKVADALLGRLYALGASTGR